MYPRFLLHYDSQELNRFSVQRFHAMWQRRIKVEAVSRIQNQFFSVDVQLHPAFYDQVEFLTGMSVVINRCILRFGLHGNNKRISLAAAEA